VAERAETLKIAVDAVLPDIDGVPAAGSCNGHDVDEEGGDMGALSVLLIAVGAILTFAVDVVADGVNLDAVGIILMIVGAVGLVVSLLRGSMLGFTSTHERHVSPDGRTVVEREHQSAI